MVHAGDGDSRRHVPRTDLLLQDPRLQRATHLLGQRVVHGAVQAAQEQARAGAVVPESVADLAVALLPPRLTALRPVLNATGVVLHTNLGRAPLSPGAVQAMTTAAAYVDVEYDVASGTRAPRGRGALDALRAAVPLAQDVLVVNNGAAALVLCTTALATGAEVVVSRGELVEIGAGFRLPALIASTGASLREVGTTNRTHLTDYADAVSDRTGCVLKVHPSNFRVEGFTSEVPVAELARLGPPVLADVGSGLLHPHPLLPDEPDVTSALRDGAALVTCSGDKLLGGPQAGLVFGQAALIDRIRRHPLARALRVDKTTLAALEATLRGPMTPTEQALTADPAELHRRCQRLADEVGGQVVPSDGAVGGGGAPGLVLPGWAVSLPSSNAVGLRQGDPCVVARVERDRCLLDLRCIPVADDDRLAAAVRACT